MELPTTVITKYNFYDFCTGKSIYKRDLTLFNLHFWIVNILGLAWRGQLRQEERKCQIQLFDDSTLEKKPSFLHWMPSNAVFSTCLTALQSQSTFMSYM